MPAESRQLTDFPDRYDAMLVKELRQGLRARWFVVPFILVHLVALGSVWLEYHLTQSGTALFGDSDSGHRVFWGITFVAVAGVIPLRSLNSLTGEMQEGNAQLIMLAGLTRWRIVLGHWLTQMALCGLTLVSLLPYGIVRYFFGGVEATANLAALGLVICCSSAVSGILLGASGYSGWGMRIFTSALAFFFVTVPGFSLVMASSKGFSFLNGAGGVGSLMKVGIVLFTIETAAFFTVGGLQLARARLRCFIRPWEFPPSRPVVVLLSLYYLYAGIGVGATCGFGLPFAPLLMIWWVWSIDSPRRRLPAPLAPPPPRQPPPPPPSLPPPPALSALPS